MTGNTQHYSIWAASMVASLAAAFAAVGAVSASRANDGDRTHCEIVASASRGILTLEGRAGGMEALSGAYRFEVMGPGTTIRQAGPFGAAAGASATLGSAKLGGSGPYRATLEINANGETVRCGEWIGGAL